MEAVRAPSHTLSRSILFSSPPQFREPLAPSTVPWNAAHLLSGLGPWAQSQRPYTSPVTRPYTSPVTSSAALLPPMGLRWSSQEISTVLINDSGGSRTVTSGGTRTVAPEARDLISLLRCAKRGLVVVGELLGPEEAVQALRISRALGGWPIAADVLSGLRIGSRSGSAEAAGKEASTLTHTSSHTSLVVHHMDHLLLGDKAWWACLRPDVIVQIGAHGTSKRLAQFMASPDMRGGACFGCYCFVAWLHTCGKCVWGI